MRRKKLSGGKNGKLKDGKQIYSWLSLPSSFGASVAAVKSSRDKKNTKHKFLQLFNNFFIHFRDELFSPAHFWVFCSHPFHFISISISLPSFFTALAQSAQGDSDFLSHLVRVAMQTTARGFFMSSFHSNLIKIKQLEFSLRVLSFFLDFTARHRSCLLLVCMHRPKKWLTKHGFGEFRMHSWKKSSPFLFLVYSSCKCLCSIR